MLRRAVKERINRVVVVTVPVVALLLVFIIIVFSSNGNSPDASDGSRSNVK